MTATSEGDDMADDIAGDRGRTASDRPIYFAEEIAFVYFIYQVHEHCEDRSFAHPCSLPHYVKVGTTTTTPESRVKNIQTSSPQEVVLLAVIEVGPDNPDLPIGMPATDRAKRSASRLERQVHHALAEFRVRGEWFEWQGSSAQEIEQEIGRTLDHSLHHGFTSRRCEFCRTRLRPNYAWSAA